MKNNERLKFYKGANRKWLYADSPTTRRKYRIQFHWGTGRWVAYVRKGRVHEEVGYSDDLTGVGRTLQPSLVTVKFKIKSCNNHNSISKK